MKSTSHGLNLHTTIAINNNVIIIGVYTNYLTVPDLNGILSECFVWKCIITAQVSHMTLSNNQHFEETSSYN